MFKEPIIILNHLPWDFPCDFIKQTSLILAKKTKTIVTSPTNLLTLRQLIVGERSNLDELTDNNKNIIHFPSIGVFPFQRFSIIRKINHNLNFFLLRIFYLIKFGKIKPIIWFFSYQMEEIIPLLKWGKILIYDRVDEVGSLEKKEDIKRKKQDKILAQKSDFVFTNSPYSLRILKKYNSNSFLTPNGCAIELFLKKRIKIPEILKNIKKPIIGLIGSLDHRIDFKIVNSIVKKRKEWSFVFVGSTFSREKSQFKIADLDTWLKKLSKYQNVFFLGQQPKEDMPDFIDGFDVCIIPYDLSQEFVKGCNPLKLYEYLAMGKPVVSTPIESVQSFFPTVAIANNAVSFENAIKNFLAKKDKTSIDQRKKIAFESSWLKKIEIILKTINYASK